MHIDTYIYSDVDIDAPVRVVIIFFSEFCRSLVWLANPGFHCYCSLAIYILNKIHKFNVRFSMQVFYKIFTMGKLRSIQEIVLRYFSFMFIIHI